MDNATLVAYALIGMLVLALGYWLFNEVRQHYNKVLAELKTDDDEPQVSWGGDKQRDKVVHRDSRGWVSDRLVLLHKDELHKASEGIECALVAGAMNDWSWAMQMCDEAVPELKLVRNKRTRLHYAIAIMLQSAQAHGDKVLVARSRRALDAFKRRVPAV
jgi:hypothetical protein